MSETLTRPHPSTLPAPRQASPPGRRPRDPWFDNAKMLLVTLVVVGHSWTLLADTFTTTWAYNFLYLWHIPAFVMVTGYLSRSFTFSRRNLGRLLSTVVVPYLVFELALTTFRSAVGGEHHGPLFVNPHWPMWYLAVLLVWRLATPLLQRMPHALPVAVLVSLVGGAFTGDTLDLARATGLLPFFVMGLLATPEHVAMLRRPAARLSAFAVLGLGLVVATAVEHHLGSTEWLYWRSSYAELDVSVAAGVAGRLLLLGAAAALAVSALALVPGRGGWFSRLGSATFVVYLFHGFLVKSVSYTGFPAWTEQHPTVGLGLCTVAAVAVALLLAAAPVAGRLNLLVDPVGRRQRAVAAAPVSR
jgi:fucose 4-O-acetylase-like acetyltransferase